MSPESKCESCGAITKELFEKGNKLVCKKCKPDNRTKGVIVKAKPPIGLGRGRITKMA